MPHINVLALLAGWLALRCDVTAAVEVSTARRGILAAAPDGASPLLSLLKELRAEKEANVRLTSSLAQWCRGALKQKAGMAEALRWKLNEAKATARQLDMDERRLGGELSLASSAHQEKQQQLATAVSTADGAAADYASQQEELEKTMNAAANAVKYIEQSQDGLFRDLAGPTLLQIASKNGMEGLLAHGHGAKSADAEELLQMVVRLRDRAQQERDDGAKQYRVVQQKLWTFTDHLNSSIMESQSQLAAIGAELAQRKREHSRIDAKIEGFSALLTAVGASKDATGAMCLDQGRRHGGVMDFISRETNAVKDLVNQLPTGFVSASPSFLQVHQQDRGLQQVRDSLEALEQNFPGEAALYDEGLHHVEETQQDALVQTAMKPAAVKVQNSGADDQGRDAADDSKGSTDALQDIKQFVSANADVGEDSKDSEPLFSDPTTVKKVQGVYAALAGNLQSKQKAVADQAGWCASIRRDAAVDVAALSRSTKRIEAKVNIAKVAMAENTRSSEYDASQQKAIESQLGQLRDFLGEEDREQARSVDALNEHAHRLFAEANDVGQDGNGQRIQMIKDLSQMIDGHQLALQQQQAHLTEQRDAIESADKAIQRLLAQEARHNRHRLVRLRAEAQMLSSLEEARREDQGLGQRYDEVANKMCSQGRLRQLNSKEQELEREAVALHKAWASNAGPAAV